MSLAVSAGAVRPPPCLLMPLLLDSSPPSLTVVWTSSPLTASTVSTIRPSFSSSVSPGLHVARQLLVVEAHALDVARLGARGIEHELRARLQHDLAFGELADADLGALQVGHDRDLAAGAWLTSRTSFARSMWSCALPWLKFSRTTLTPARIMRSSNAGSLEAGPRVATILVARRAMDALLGLFVEKDCPMEGLRSQRGCAAYAGLAASGAAVRGTCSQRHRRRYSGISA